MAGELVQGMVYEFKLSKHATINLAWRYGLEFDVDDLLEVTFDKIITDEDGRLKGKFTHIETGKRLQLVVTDRSPFAVITALSNDVALNNETARIMASQLEVANCANASLFSLSFIVDFRARYLESQGRVTKDDLRREINKKFSEAGEVNPVESLKLPPEFFDEVIRLRRAVKYLSIEHEVDELTGKESSRQAGKLKDILGISSFDKLSDLAKTEHTLMYKETKEGADALRRKYQAYLASDEYRQLQRENYENNLAEARKQNEEERFWEKLRSAKYGLPESGVEKSQNPGEQNVLSLPDAEIIHIPSKQGDAGQWYLFFETQAQTYVLGTKIKSIRDSYAEGMIGVKVIDYGDRYFLKKNS